MNFEELHNITENFCNTHSFEAFGEPVFDYDHQCYNYDVPSTFYNSLVFAACANEKLTKILVKLSKKEILNNKEKSIIYILRNIESLLEKHKHFEDEYIYQSRRASSHEELQSLHIDFNTVTRDVNHMIKEFYSLIINLEDSNFREKHTSLTFRKKINNTHISYLMILREEILKNEDLGKIEVMLLNIITEHFELLINVASFKEYFFRFLADPLNELYFPKRQKFETEEKYFKSIQKTQSRYFVTHQDQEEKNMKLAS